MVTYSVSTKPYPVDAGGKEIRSNSSMQKVGSGESSAALAPGSFTVKGTTDQKGYATNGQTIDFWVENIQNVNGQLNDWQYLASSTTGYFAGVPVAAGTYWRIGEDAVGGALQDTASGGYANLIVGSISDSSGNVPFGEATPNILIDSSTFSTTVTGLSWKLIRPMNLYGYTAGQPREWLCTPSSAMTLNQTL